MIITAHVGETRDGLPLAELREDGRTVAKLYANREGTKFRVVFPELVDFTQTRIVPESHLIEFERRSRRKT